MRIIAGSARGRRLSVPKGMETRPTSDRVREALFSILTPRVASARVLDLFAGTGAFGLEAVSRGAERAILVDSGRAARLAISENIDKLGFSGRVTLLPLDYKAALSRLSGEAFDIVFLDPPYRMRPEGLLADIRRFVTFAEGALIVLEHARQTDIPPVPFPIVDRRQYGDTALTFFAPPDATDETGENG